MFIQITKEQLNCINLKDSKEKKKKTRKEQ